MGNLLSSDNFGEKVVVVRGVKIMLDRDVASAVGTETPRLNENAKQSPKWEHLRQKGIEYEYRFQLTKEEVEDVKSKISIMSEFKYLPWVYTRKGCAYFGASMNTSEACEQAIRLVEVFDKVQDLSVMSASERNMMMMEMFLAQWKEEVALNKAQEAEIRALKIITSSADKRILQVETSHNMVGNYFAVKGYASKRGVPISEPLAAKIGKSVSKYCRENDIHISKTTHHLYGEINTYHEDALAAVWPKYFEEHGD